MGENSLSGVVDVVSYLDGGGLLLFQQIKCFISFSNQSGFN